MWKLAHVSKLVGVALVLLVCVASVSAEGVESDGVAIDVAQVELGTVDVDATCNVLDVDAVPIFSTVLDQIKQDACNCRDLCRFDFQCGPGGSCVPVGPCGCKECAASS